MLRWKLRSSAFEAGGEMIRQNVFVGVVVVVVDSYWIRSMMLPASTSIATHKQTRLEIKWIIV